ncbi:hypothetical protein GW17_00052809 [Ensete ventricosum]|nr:hypothetical protein GW17_00052809 [Ensete ventricosum]
MDPIASPILLAPMHSTTNRPMSSDRFEKTFAGVHFQHRVVRHYERLLLSPSPELVGPASGNRRPIFFDRNPTPPSAGRAESHVQKISLHRERSSRDGPQLSGFVSRDGVGVHMEMRIPSER